MSPDPNCHRTSGNATDAAGCLRVKIARDPDDQAQNLTDWDQLYDQLSPGKFHGTLTELWLEQLQVFRETTSHAIRQSCEVWADSVWFGIPVQQDRVGSIGAHPISEDTIAVRPGNVRFELLTPEGFDILGIVVKKAALTGFAAEVEHRGTDSTFYLRPALAIGAARKQSVRSAILQVLEEAATNETILLHAASRAAMRDALFGMLLELTAFDEPRHFRLPANVNRYRVVSRVRDYIIENSSAAINVPDLCREFRVSRRTLQYCFQDVLGMSPISYLRAIRLNGVRRDLRSPARPPTVQDTAAAWGFWHLGQFARDYRKLFGENPSDSLRARSRPSAMPGLPA